MILNYIFGKKAAKGRKINKRTVNNTSLMGFLPRASAGMSRSTAANYLTAARSLIRFCGGTDLMLRDLSNDTVRSYVRWLAAQGVSPNTSACYLRSLRAVYNKAAVCLRFRNRCPFEGVPTANTETVKRSLDQEALRRLLALELPKGSMLELARDLFLFSLYAMGMPFVDLARLKRSQIRDGYIMYRRQKTGRGVRVRIEPLMEDIIRKYDDGSEYVFPILRGRSYETALNAYNRRLRRIGHMAGLGTALTSYVARHTWASAAYRNNVDLPIISRALGHANTRTTLVYVREIDDTRVAEANRRLLEKICTPLGKRQAPGC